jgi:transcription elongation factor Elf1
VLEKTTAMDSESQVGSPTKMKQPTTNTNIHAPTSEQEFAHSNHLLSEIQAMCNTLPVNNPIQMSPGVDLVAVQSNLIEVIRITATLLGQVQNARSAAAQQTRHNVLPQIVLDNNVANEDNILHAHGPPPTPKLQLATKTRVRAINSAVESEESRNITDEIPNIFTCYTCDLRFDSIADYTIHIQHKHDVSLASMPKYDIIPDWYHPQNYCRACHGTLHSYSLNVNHIRMEHHMHRQSRYDMIHACGSCHQRFATAAQLKKHWATAHSSFKSWDCPFCSKYYSRHAMLVDHMKINHPVVGCETCRRRFNSIDGSASMDQSVYSARLV